MSGKSENLCPFGARLNCVKSQKSQWAKSGELGEWSIFIMDFLTRKPTFLVISRFRALSHSQILSNSVALFLYPYAIHLLLLSHLLFSLGAPKLVLLHYCQPSLALLTAQWVILHIFSPFLEWPIPFKGTQFLQNVFTISKFQRANISLELLPIFTQNFSSICCSRFLSLIIFAKSMLQTCTTSSAAWERMAHSVYSA
jgi:hypothetical protein